MQFLVRVEMKLMFIRVLSPEILRSPILCRISTWKGLMAIFTALLIMELLCI